MPCSAAPTEISRMNVDVDGRAMESTESGTSCIHGGVEKIHGFEREGHIAGR